MKLGCRNFCCLLLIVLLVSCWEKKAQVSQADVVSSTDTLVVETPQEPEVEVEQEPAPTRADELFDDFIWNFASDQRLQRRRVKFPIPYITPEDTLLIERQDWQHDNLLADQNTYTIMFDNESDLEREGDTSLDAAEIEWISLEDKTHKHYYFSKNRGAWMLDSICLVQLPPMADLSGFIDFYAHFASDSLYQLEHITNPIEFVTLDPDDEFSILETTLGISQWFAFRPELPKERLANINYGQTNSNRSRRKILKVNGFQDGSSIILYFRKRGNDWEMYKFEDTSI